MPSTCTVPLITDPPAFLSYSPVTPFEVSKLIACAKPSPTDILPVFLLKSCSFLFPVIIADLANLSFTEGTFPTCYKTAQVIPLLKKPSLDPDDTSSFHPISNLRTLGKILERLSHLRLSPHVFSSGSFSSLQSGYRPKHSTETALLKATNDLFRAADTGSPSVLIALDLSAAFDCVSHPLLLNRLVTDFDFGGAALSWLSSYLTGRFHHLKVGEGRSPQISVDSGVPQGSVLGPLLFSLYISPIERLVNSCCVNHITYADDITLYVNLKGCATTELSRLSNCVQSVSE